MKRRTVLTVAALALLIASVCPQTLALGLRSVGLRLILPFTGVPLYLGAEVVTEASFGDLSISLFLSPAGGTLLLGSADIALTGATGPASAFLRLTTGLAYFDSSRFLPSLLFGAGTTVRFSGADPLALALSGEMIYPLAFPVPMLSLSAGYALP